MNRQILRAAAAAILISAFAVSAAAQEPNGPLRGLTRQEAEIIVPRPALRPVKSLIISDATPLDTLPTGNEFIKVVLYSDNTWRYLKDPALSSRTDVFREYWTPVKVNPYGMPLDSLPVRWSLWVVDSLHQFCCPYQGDVHVRGKFGIRRGRRHQGVDLPLVTGTPVKATFDGKVRISRYMGAYGNLVVLRHENGLETFYAHLSKRLVKEDDWVQAGDVVGLGGSTGRATGPHLHYEVRYNGFAIDPQWLVDFKDGLLRHRLFTLKRRYFTPECSYEQNFDEEFLNAEEDAKEDAERAAMKYHTVRSGDTLSGIAAANGTTVSALCRLNGISRDTILKVGRRLRVK